MQKRIIQAIRHVGFEDLGSFSKPLQRAGYTIEYIDASEHDIGSVDPLQPDILAVLGGPNGVNDHGNYPKIALEQKLLQARLAENLPTVGICLGAQLIAAALGSSVYPASRKEIGWSSVTLSKAGARSPLSALECTSVLHWHEDTFDLPNGCDNLAATDFCAQQAFSRGPNILALQFHAELQASMFEHWLVGNAYQLATLSLSPEELRADNQRYGMSLESAASTMFSEWLGNLEW